jgi:tRNA dimethylallyltransferase
VPRSNAASSAPDGGGPRPLAIVGPTASGKTGVGILLAEALRTEIIGCDSRQVYRRLDIGTAKPTAAERARMPHRLVDIVEPAERFSAADYREAVLPLLAACAAASRPALFVGGTGLYLRAALEGLSPAPPALPQLRRWIEALAGDLPSGLHPLLGRVDPDAAARVHRNDRYRIVRALEVHHLCGEALSARHVRHRTVARALPARMFAIDLPAPELRRRIERRLAEMLEAGLLEEARGLFEEGLDRSLPALRAVGYPELFSHFRGETSLDAALEAIRRATWQYARRQLTWFRALPEITWVSGGPGVTEEALASQIAARLRREGANR